MNYTLSTRPGSAYLVIEGQTIQLTADEAAALSSSLEHAALEARRKQALSQHAEARDAFLAGIWPLAECPAWQAPMPAAEIRRAGPWLTDGWVAVHAAALDSATLADRPITPVADRIAQVLADKIAAVARRPQLTPAGWTQVHSSRETRAAVVVFSEDGNSVVLFDALAWGWAYAATGATRISGCTAQHKIAVFWNAADEPVAILQSLEATVAWQPGAGPRA